MSEKNLQNFTCKWDLTCAKVRSFTSISSRTDLGVAPIKIPQKSEINIIEFILLPR